MTESTWHASCLKHRCLVAMVAFTDMDPAYHRVNGSDGCTCAPETLAIHHMNHSPLDVVKDAELQVAEYRKFVDAFDRSVPCSAVPGANEATVPLDWFHDLLEIRVTMTHKSNDLRQSDVDRAGLCGQCGTIHAAGQNTLCSR